VLRARDALWLYIVLHGQLLMAQQVHVSHKAFTALATAAACHVTVAGLQYIAAV